MLAVDLQREFLVDGIAVSEAPDPAAVAARCHFGIAETAAVQKILRPHIDRMRINVAAVVEIDSSKRIVCSENIGDAVGVTGLHRR